MDESSHVHHIHSEAGRERQSKTDSLGGDLQLPTSLQEEPYCCQEFRGGIALSPAKFLVCTHVSGSIVSYQNNVIILMLIRMDKIYVGDAAANRW